MIDPEHITNYDLTYLQLEKRLMFWVLAAGKNGRTAARSIVSLMTLTAGHIYGPFAGIKQSNARHPLAETMKRCGIGCYNHKARTLLELANSNLDLKYCDAADLEKIYGIGMKTSRCFILHSRRNARLSGLDTHMLKHLKEMGVENVPKATPSSKKQYMILEQEVLRLADEAGMSAAEYDLMIWNKYSVR
jgi:thermostable 8-oxoguanine DNA glycosylase